MCSEGLREQELTISELRFLQMENGKEFRLYLVSAFPVHALQTGKAFWRMLGDSVAYQMVSVQQFKQ